MSVASRNRLAAAAALGIFLLAAAASPNFRFEDGPHAEAFGGDFIHEYAGGWLVRHGDPSRFYDPALARAVEHDRTAMGFTWNADEWLPIVYPPFYYVAVAPLTLLPFRTAAVVFIALMLLAFAATIAVVVRAAPERRPLVPWMLLVGACFGPLWKSLLSAQKGTLLLLLLTASWALFASGRKGASGFVFGLVAFKPQLAPVIGTAMLARREWAFVGGAATSVALAIAASLPLGVDLWRQYVSVASQAGVYLQTAGFPIESMHCWYGFFRILWPGASLAVVQTATLVAAVVTIALLALLCRRASHLPEPARTAFEWSGLVIATVLLSFHLLEYDLTILLLPVLLLGVLLLDADPALSADRTLILGLLALVFVAAGASSQLVAATRVQATIPLLALLLAALVRASPS